MLFRIVTLWCIATLCMCCTGGTGQNGYNLPHTDSITWLLHKGVSQPDSMAGAYLERALYLSQQKNAGKSVQFDLYYHLGVQSEKAGNYDLAESYFREVDKFSDRAYLSKKGTAYNHIGQITLRKGKYDVAMEFFPKALTIRIQLNDREGQASSYRNIGTAYQKAGHYEQAQEQYEQSMSLYASLNNELGKADVLNNLGGLWLEQNKPGQALEYYLESEKIYSATGSDEQLWNVFNNIGWTYLLMNETEQAYEYYLKMLQLSRSLSSPSFLAETYCTVGTFFDDRQQPDSAVHYYGKAIEIAYSSKLYEVLYDALEKRSRLYADEGRYREAYNDLIAHAYAYDEVNNRENIRAFTEKAGQYKFDMLQQQQLYENHIQRIFIIALSVAALLVGAVLVVLHRSFVQKKKANALLAGQNDLLEHQKEEITDSIRYASLIQKATLPAKDYTDSVLPEHFIYYKPRDIVSGDFYWIDRTGDHIIVAAADCTGHGVPGAIVSMLGLSALKKIAGRMKTPKADEILNELRGEIIHLLNPVGSADRRQDGMDIALVVIHTQNREMEYAGAYNPLYVIRDGQLIEKKANKMPIGLYVKKEESFTAHMLDYQSGDAIYLFSDGYADQFGGTDGAKFKTKNFKELLVNINGHSMEEQMHILEKTHVEWKGKYPQIDDILVIGIKLG